MESETLLSSTIFLWKCAKIGFPNFQNTVGMHFFWATNLQVLDGKWDPLCFSDCQLLSEAAASFTRNELAHALRKGPFQADKPRQEVGIHASPCNPAGSINHLIW